MFPLFKTVSISKATSYITWVRKLTLDLPNINLHLAVSGWRYLVITDLDIRATFIKHSTLQQG